MSQLDKLHERYAYFIEKTRLNQAVYILYNKYKGEIALNIDKKNKSYLYLFPDETSGTLFLNANTDMKKYRPHKWELAFFLNNAVPRLKNENTIDAFVFPNSEGIGYNVSMDRIVKDLVKKPEQHIDGKTIQKLINYLDEKLVKGCNHDYTLTQRFCTDNQINFLTLVEWLREHGGYCDCEVLANIEDILEE